MMQLIDAEASLRIDVFRAGGGIIRRAISVEGPSGPLRVISVEDVLAHEAKAAAGPCRKRARTGKARRRLPATCGVSEIVQHGNCVAGSPETDLPDDIRRGGHISQSVDRSSAQPPVLTIPKTLTRSAAVVCQLLRSSWLT
jgi:hypothetical protein